MPRFLLSPGPAPQEAGREARVWKRLDEGRQPQFEGLPVPEARCPQTPLQGSPTCLRPGRGRGTCHAHRAPPPEGLPGVCSPLTAPFLTGPLKCQWPPRPTDHVRCYPADTHLLSTYYRLSPALQSAGRGAGGPCFPGPSVSCRAAQGAGGSPEAPLTRVLGLAPLRFRPGLWQGPRGRLAVLPLPGVGRPPGFSEPRFPHLRTGLDWWLPVPHHLPSTDFNGMSGRSFVRFSLVVFIVNEFDPDTHK